MDPYESFAPFYDLDLREHEDDLLLLEQFGARCGSPILELGCGTGRLLLHLARQGFRLTGVDLSTEMLARAEHRLRVQGLDRHVTLVQQDVRSLSLPERFSLAFCVLNTFMHLETCDDQIAALEGVFRHLKAGGILLLDVINPDLGRLLEAPGQVTLESVARSPETGHTVVKQCARRADRGRQLIHATFLVDEIDDQGRVRRTLCPFTMRYYFRPELELLLRHTGFELEAVYGSYDLDEFTGESERIIAVGRRPA